VLVVSATGLAPRWALHLAAWVGHTGDAAAYGAIDPDPSLMPAATSVFHDGDDWRHVGQVIVYLRSHPTRRPLVYLIGGSAARECTTSDAGWRRQIVEHGGPATLAYNLGSSGQSFHDDLRIVKLLPQQASIVFIGVNVGRYALRTPVSDRLGTAIRRAEQVDTPLISPYTQHRYTASRIRSPAKKRDLVTQWLARKYPIFQRQFAYNAGLLRKIVAACQARGLHPVLLNMPLNLAIVGHRLDKPRARYAANCRAMAKELGVPYVDWVPSINLVNTDFLDNWHLVEPGRTKWQRRLTNLTITLLKRYDMLPSPEPSPSPSPSPSSPEPTVPPTTSPAPATTTSQPTAGTGG
jgi:hypothetical protein